MAEGPDEFGALARCEPGYRTLPGWNQPTAGVARLGDLPREAQHYLDTVEELSSVPVTLGFDGTRSGGVREAEEDADREGLRRKRGCPSRTGGWRYAAFAALRAAVPV